MQSGNGGGSGDPSDRSIDDLLGEWQKTGSPADRNQMAGKVLAEAQKLSRQIPLLRRGGSYYDRDDIAAEAADDFIRMAQEGKVQRENNIRGLLRAMVRTAAVRWHKHEYTQKEGGGKTIRQSEIQDKTGNWTDWVDKGDTRPEDWRRDDMGMTASERHYLEEAISRIPSGAQKQAREYLLLTESESPDVKTSQPDHDQKQRNRVWQQITRIRKRLISAMETMGSEYEAAGKSDDRDAVDELREKFLSLAKPQGEAGKPSGKTR